MRTNVLYFADGEKIIQTGAALAGLREVLRTLAAAYSSDEAVLPDLHARLVGAAISLGELNQGVMDALYPEEDSVSTVTGGLNGASRMLGRCVFASNLVLRNGAVETAGIAGMMNSALSSVCGLLALDLPEYVCARIPEGYAFYSLYPEMYFESLGRLVRALPSGDGYFVIGVRSIGTSLGGLVAGALEQAGHDVRFETVRPRGRPFERHLALSQQFQELVWREKDRVFVAVDEGPGLTCSSLLSVSAALEQIGVPGGRFAVLSAWEGAPSIYASDDLRSRWKRQNVYCTSVADAFDGWRHLVRFVEACLRDRYPGGIFTSAQVGPNVSDLSYGKWREKCYSSADEWPAVHRPSERTKLLLTPASPAVPPEGFPSGGLIAKFAGLGSYGEAKFGRAQALANGGFSPAVLGLAYGFMIHEFVDGRPMSAHDLSRDVIERMAEYYAFVYRRFVSEPEPRFTRLARLISYNCEAVGLDATGFVDDWQAASDSIDQLPLVELDGRPFPHEWIACETPSGVRLLKTDSADHALDHTLVGKQAILWDLAGACEEWEMNAAERAELVDAWEALTGSEATGRYLPFFGAAYLAFRAAALHYAIHSTNEEEIRIGLIGQQSRTRLRLATALDERLDALCGAPVPARRTPILLKPLNS